jgi:hypothetical protein
MITGAGQMDGVILVRKNMQNQNIYWITRLDTYTIGKMSGFLWTGRKRMILIQE